MPTDAPDALACNLCHATDYTVLFAPGEAQVHQVVRCAGCGLMYANPREASDLDDIESWPDDPSFDVARERPQRYEKEVLQVRDHATTRARLAALHPGRGRLVEVGSSMGLLLQAFASDGWDVLGVEPDRNAWRHAVERLGLRCLNGTLEGARLPDASADAVVMLHVIEHLPDPSATLREIHRVLRPGGHLVLETPRYDTLAFRLLGRRERSLSCDGHIYFFTTETLLRACRAAGFERVEHSYPGRTLTLDRVLFNVGVMAKSDAVLARLQALSRRLRLERLRLTVSLRDMQRVLLQKPAAGAEAAR